MLSRLSRDILRRAAHFSLRPAIRRANRARIVSPLCISEPISIMSMYANAASIFPDHSALRLRAPILTQAMKTHRFTR